jgi:long-chain acyl-CoA synthetase
VTILLARHDAGRAAVVDTAQRAELTWGSLLEQVSSTAQLLRREAGVGLVFLVTAHTAESVVLYLACLEARCPVCLIEPGAPTDRIIAAFSPDALLLPARAECPEGFAEARALLQSRYRLHVARTRIPRFLHPDLALLLTTSGSTGSPKLVRLTLGNLVANAVSIVEYLGITPEERGMQSLPMHYSYGLSLINSHLAAGASIALTPFSFLQPQFWQAFDAARCTSFAGVPYIYETLHRLRFDPRRYPALHTMTQAGGALRPDLIREFYRKASSSGKRFFVMYGQTEATARISYVPWERLGEKIGSIGIAIPAGSLWLDKADGQTPSELIYSGPNVMMGYASDDEDLACGDTLGGILRTGDLAEADAEGFYFLQGRLKRFAKLYGKRISLEDIEQELERAYPMTAAVLEHGGGLRIFAALRGEVDLAAAALNVARQLNVPPKSISTESLPAIPLTSSGKKDYKALGL